VIKDLLALPVSRVTIVVAKFMVIVIWSMLLTAILLGVGVLTGLVIHLPGWSTAIAVHAVGIFCGSAFLTIILCAPVAFLASTSRGFLLPIGFAIFTLPYVPWAIPALFSGIAGQEPMPTAGWASYLVLTVTVVAGFAGTALWWRYADQT
jgi:ABC-2 type transport system permease protein